MNYTPIFSTGFFDGVKADVLAGSIGWLGVVVAVAGAAIIIKVLFR